MATAERAYYGSQSPQRMRIADTNIQQNNTSSSGIVNSTDKRRVILTTLFIGLICIAMVVLAAYSAQLRCSNNDLIRANDALQGEIDTLSIKIQSANSLESIEKIAINKLGMIYPDPAQCVYVTDDDTPDSDFATAIKEQAYN